MLLVHVKYFIILFLNRLTLSNHPLHFLSYKKYIIMVINDNKMIIKLQILVNLRNKSQDIIPIVSHCLFKSANPY